MRWATPPITTLGACLFACLLGFLSPLGLLPPWPPVPSVSVWAPPRFWPPLYVIMGPSPPLRLPSLAVGLLGCLLPCLPLWLRLLLRVLAGALPWSLSVLLRCFVGGPRYSQKYQLSRRRSYLIAGQRSLLGPVGGFRLVGRCFGSTGET